MHRAGIEPERKCLVARQITQIDLQNNASLCNLVVMKCQKFPLEVKVGSAVVKIYHGKVKHGGKKYDLFTLATTRTENANAKHSGISMMRKKQRIKLRSRSPRGGRI